MTYKIEESWLHARTPKEIEELAERYIQEYAKYVRALASHQKWQECISGINRMQRESFWSCDAMNVKIKVGDICYFDFGHAYLNEAGFQHFGLVIRVVNHKVLVVPMSSNVDLVGQARNVSKDPYMRKNHLFYIGKLEGLHRPSVLFLNDMKFINSSRVISRKSYLSQDSGMFQEIEKCVGELLKIEI